MTKSHSQDQESTLLRLEHAQAILQRDAALAHIEHMRRSRSWRLTRPLRMLMQLLRHGVINDESEYPTHLPSLVQPLPASIPLEPDIVEDLSLIHI